jgi:hypothetical protein
MEMTWTGWDGSEWNLTEQGSPVVLMPDLEGLDMEEPGHIWTESASVTGATWRGYRPGPRPVVWQVFVWSDGSTQDWVELDRAWWNTMLPEKRGTWTVTQASGSRRYLDLRFDSVASPGFVRDPSYAGWARYAINLIAEEPHWREDPITVPFYPKAPVKFHGPPGVINISSSSSFAEASILNPGNVEGWIDWTVFGPVSSAVVGVGSSRIEIPFALAAGESVTVWTHPTQRQAIDNSQVDRTDQLGDVKFSSVPAGETAALSLVQNNAGEGAYIEASLTPLFHRAW